MTRLEALAVRILAAFMVRASDRRDRRTIARHAALASALARTATPR